MRLTFLSLTIGLSLVAGVGGFTPDRSTLHGIVVDQAGKPVDHATVLIFHAGPKRGYSVYCPSCYIDCGKRATTALDGSFTIHNLDPNLRFEILAVREGFEPKFVKAVDPMSSVPVKAVLHARASRAQDPRGLVRGRVTDAHGAPLRDVVVSVEGLSKMTEFPSEPGKKEEASLYFFGGTTKGLESVAVSNDRGEFQLSYNQPAIAMLLKLEGRGFAPKWQVAATGEQRETITLQRGAAIQGRLTDHGKPVADAEIAIIPVHKEGFGGHLKSVGDPYEEIRVGTQPDGTFTLADVPAPVKWWAYVKAESMGPRGTIQPFECATAHAQEVVDLGNLTVIPGHRLSGVVHMQDYHALPPGLTMRMFFTAPQDSAAVPVQPDGRFEFRGLPRGSYDLNPETQDFQETEPVRGLLVERDISDLRITLVKK